jgi:MoxR-like ATPase
MLDYSASDHPVDTLVPCATLDDLRAARAAASRVAVADALRQYIVALVAGTRQRAEIRMGASPRGSITIFQLARALALVDGMEYVTPDHVQSIAVEVLAHRIALDPQAHYSGAASTELVREIVAATPVPV